MKQNKRAIVGLSTFSLLILIFILILIGSYYFSNKYTTQDKNLIAKIELENSLTSFRSSLIDITVYNNSYLVYKNNYGLGSIAIYLNNTLISGVLDDGDYYAKTNISSLGLKFCSNYTISSKVMSQFYFNGSCISLG